MQARCPHCRNVFSTERSGVQFCPSCGNQVDVPAPAAGSAPGAPPPPPPSEGQPTTFGDTPWERRAELGFFPALFQTWKESMFQPQAFWRQVRPSGRFGDALIYAWIIRIVAAILALPFNALEFGSGNLRQIVANNPNLPPNLQKLFEQIAQHQTGGSLAVSFLSTVILFPLGLIIMAGILHLFCLMFGVAKNGFEATFRVLCYSSAPTIFSFFPCFVPLVLIYEVVLLIFGLATVQESTQGRAAGAVLTPVILFPLCCCGLIILVAGAGIAAMGAAH